MTEPEAVPAVRPISHISTIWAWIFVGLLTVGLAVGIVGRVLSRAVILDLVSFWPFLVLVFLIAATVMPRSRGRWLGSVVPLLLIGWLVTAIVLHVNRWDQLPSSAAELAGPIHVGSATLGVEVAGVIEVRGASGQPEAYRVIPRRPGGPVGGPEALERQQDTQLTVELRPTATSAWFQSEGWDVLLDQRLVWVLRLVGGDISADLDGMTVASLDITGDGLARLGSSAQSAMNVTIDGNVTLVIPELTPVRVVGDATVPSFYTPTDEGYVSTDGEALVTITVVAGQVTVEAAP